MQLRMKTKGDALTKINKKPMLNLPISVNKKLENAKNVLIIGAGGGSDILCGLPLYYTFLKQGKKVHLANLTHTNFKTINETMELI